LLREHQGGADPQPEAALHEMQDGAVAAQKPDGSPAAALRPAAAAELVEAARQAQAAPPEGPKAHLRQRPWAWIRD